MFRINKNMKVVGVFLFQTNNEFKMNMNLRNIEILKNDFTEIVICDMYHEMAFALKKQMKNHFQNDKIREHFILPVQKFNMIDAMLYTLQSINAKAADYFVFVHDGLIMTHSLKDYVHYIETHQCDFCSFYDSSVNHFHYPLQVYGIHYSYITKWIYLLKRIREKVLRENIDFEKMISHQIPTYFPNHTCFLKIGRLEHNIGKNIFTQNESYFEFLLNKNLLPFISIDALENYKEKYLFDNNGCLPKLFHPKNYKEYNSDLAHMSDDQLVKHFVEFGIREDRKYHDNQYYILPKFLREMLKQLYMLDHFDVPDGFSPIDYKNVNRDLQFDKTKKFTIHYLEKGMKENRKIHE